MFLALQMFIVVVVGGGGAGTGAAAAAAIILLLLWTLTLISVRPLSVSLWCAGSKSSWLPARTSWAPARATTWSRSTWWVPALTSARTPALLHGAWPPCPCSSALCSFTSDSATACKGWSESCRSTHTPSTAFRHLPPNSARFSYATVGVLFISAQLSSDTVSALLKVRVLIWL